MAKVMADNLLYSGEGMWKLDKQTLNAKDFQKRVEKLLVKNNTWVKKYLEEEANAKGDKEKIKLLRSDGNNPQAKWKVLKREVKIIAIDVQKRERKKKEAIKRSFKKDIKKELEKAQNPHLTDGERRKATEEALFLKEKVNKTEVENMEKCSNKTCNATIFHTAAFESYEQAIQQAEHYNAFAPCAQAAPVGPVQPFYLPAPGLVPALAAPIPAPAQLPPPPFHYHTLQQRLFCSIPKDHLVVLDSAQWTAPATVLATQPLDPALNSSIPTASNSTASGNKPDTVHVRPYAVGPMWNAEARAAHEAAAIAQQRKVENHLLKMAPHRTIRLFIWHAENDLPKCFPVVVDSYPDFSLSMAAHAVSFLNISPTDTLEAWNHQHGYWELHSLSTHCHVTENQRLLYKLIRNASSSLEDGKCVGLAEELAMQPVLGKCMRPTEQVVLPVSKGLPFNLIESSAPTVSSQHSPSISVASTSPIIYKPMSCSVSPNFLLPPKRQRNTLPYEHANAEPKGKGKWRVTKKFRVWPTNFYVSEVAAGFDFIRKGRQQGHTTITSLFKEFYGQDIVPSTFKSNRKYWQEDFSDDLKQRFVSYGETPRGLWTHFLATYRSSGVEPPLKLTLEDESDVTLDMSTDIASDTLDGKTDRQCVFCFLPLPQILSQPLQVLLDEVLLPKNSYAAPTQENPLARKHRPGRGWTLHLAFCGMHMQEVDVTLEGNGQNWPVPADIQYDILGARIKSLEKELT
ncbi:hypothetical protein JB92DRAFT_3103638 [Gautieria morchelliformis]|nr:hypothetical protein JB92DRAFT_3103638 [Gautieria morchelliformis]